MNLEKIVLNCEIFPDKKHIDAIVLMNFFEVHENVELLLNQDIYWKEIFVKDGDSWVKVTPKEIEVPEEVFFKKSKLWEIEISREIIESSKGNVKIKGSYKGKILESNWDLSYIEKDFVELASYGIWYPFPPNANQYLFELTLAAPKDWLWIANGNYELYHERKGQSIWHWKSKLPDHDITLLGVPTEKAHTKEGSVFWGSEEFVTTNLDYEEELLDRKKALENWLGSSSDDYNFYYVFTPRTTGGQYARNGLIATVRELPKGENIFSRVLQGMIHEVSHFWWNKTSVDSYHNWIDEALAEYTSSVIVAEKYGGEKWLQERAERVEKALEKAGELPSIRNTPRSNKDAYTLFYYRGFLLFWELHKEIGGRLLKEIIRKFAKKCKTKEIITTKVLIETFKEFSKETDSDLVKFTNKWLDYEGIGTPKR